ncbi:MAG: PKD domain-containing protein [Saprospirales bacterium]|nr:PKD domain-containing protein [Saprospirales bacterium]
MKQLYRLFFPSFFLLLCARPSHAENSPPFGAIGDDSQFAFTVVLSPTHVICQNLGSITANAYGGVPPYLYNWGNGSNTNTIYDLQPGIYAVTVTDATGVTATASTAIEQLVTSQINADDVAKDVSAYGGQDGSIVLTPVCGGVPPYTFLWSNGNTTQNLTGLSAGIYTVTIIDSWGCEMQLACPVSQPGPTGMTIEVLSAPDIGCDSSCTTILVKHHQGFSYQWSGPSGGAGFTTTNPTVCNPGLYTVVVTDPVNGNTAAKTIRVDKKSNSSGGILILSSNPAFCAGTSSASCEQVCPGTTVTYTADPIANTCGQVKFQWTVVGAKEYLVSPDGQSVTVTWGEPGAGRLTIEAEDHFYCYFSNNQCVTIQKQPQARFASNPAPGADGVLRVCKGQAVWFENQSQDATHFDWLFTDDQSTAGSEQVQHIFSTPGTFQVLHVARSQCFCADSTWLNVEVQDAETPLVECVSTICPGETVTYSTPGNCPPYDWSVSPNGTVVAGGGATDNAITVQWLSGPEATIGLSAPNCGAACPEPAFLRVPVLSDAAKIEGPARVCPGSEANYSIASFDGARYTWKLAGSGKILEGQGTNEIRVRWESAALSPYKLIVSYENCYLDCSGSDTLLVLVRAPFGLAGPLELCAGNSGTVQAAVAGVGQPLPCNWTLYAPGGSIAWTAPAATPAATAPFLAGAGAYRMVAVPTTAALSLTCSDSLEWKVLVAPLPAKPAGIDGPAVFCPGKPLTFEATGIALQNQVQWQIKNTNGPPLEKSGNPVNADFTAGTPRWVAAWQLSPDGLGCASDTVRKLLTPVAALPILGDPELCEGALLAYSAPAYPNLDYQWSLSPADAGVIRTGQGTSKVEVYWPRAGSFELRLSICGQVSVYPVTVWPSPAAKPFAPDGLCPGTTGLVTAGAAFSAYHWKHETGAVIGANDSLFAGPGAYALIVTDDHGCQGTAEFFIQSYPRPELTITTVDPTGFCNNSRYVTISALTTADADYTYEWFWDGAPLSLDTPVYTTNQYGSYTARVTNQYGCTATDGPVVVFEYCQGVCHNPNHGPKCPPGSVGIGIEPQAQCNRFQFQVQAGAGYSPGNSTWHFGESGSNYLGSASTDNPVFIFPNAGQYLVVLYATLQNGATCVVIDSVDVEAVAQFSQARACPGDSTILNDESAFLPHAGITSWNWDFGDPASGPANQSAGRDVKHGYPAPGLYNVRLTVTAASGCTSSAVQSVLVPAPPALTPLPQAAFCAGSATPFGVAETADLTDIQWQFGDPASGIQNTAAGSQVFHKYALPGNYTALVTVTNVAGCSTALSQSFDILPNPLSGEITPAATSVLCAGQSIDLSAPSASGASYVWSDGTVGPVITVLATGVYAVTVSDVFGCTYVPPAKTVEVIPAPGGVIKALLYDDAGQVAGVQANGLSVCAGETVHLLTGNNAGYSYQWSSGGNTTVQIFSPDRFNNLPAGSYTYTVTVTDLTSGCSSVTPPFPVTVHPTPEGLSVSTDQHCAGTPANVRYDGPQAPDWQYFWNNGETGPAFVTTAPGHYFVRVVNQFGCVAKSPVVTILPGPNIAAIPSGCHVRCEPDSLCLPPMPEILSWQWFFNGAPLPGASGPGLVATESGVYWAELTDTSGCHAQSVPLTLELYTGSGDVFGKVWSDVNGNGAVDAADTLVAGISVQLWQNGVLAGSGQSATTGSFTFSNVPSVNGFVALDSTALPAGWDVIIGQSPADLIGCAATVHTQLLLQRRQCSATSGLLQASACAGSSFDFNGTPIPAGSAQQFVLQNAAGCDSVLTVQVGALQASSHTLQASACAGSSFDFNGTLIPAGSAQQFVLQNAAGCDSVLTVQVTALQASSHTLQASACAGSNFDFNGTLIPAGSAQQFVLQNAAGCDSVLTVQVAALQASSHTFQASACAGSSFDFNGTLIPAGSAQQFVLQNAAGCDSVLTVQVAALQASSHTFQASACAGSSFDFNGTLIPAGSMQQFVLQNAAGCDSVLTVQVAALQTSSHTLQASACAGSSFDFNGTLIPAGSAQQFVLQNAAGCDSVLTVQVGALQASSHTLQASACAGSSFDFNGTPVPAGSAQQFVLQNAAGCDSVLTVQVSALQASSHTLQVRVCADSVFDYNGTLLTAGASQDFILQNAQGCDSVLTIVVEAAPAIFDTLHVSACAGENYDYFGTLIPAGFSQQFKLQSQLGCDSILTIVVKECHASTAYLSLSACAGSGLDYNGTFIPAGSSNLFLFENANAYGCDSTLVITVAEIPPVQTQLQPAHACAGTASGSLTIAGATGGAPPLLFSLDGQSFQPGQYFGNLDAGAYTLHVLDNAGCTTEQPFAIASIPVPDFELPERVVLPCDQSSVTLQPVFSADPAGWNFLWWNGSADQSVQISEPGQVWLEISNACGRVRKNAQVWWDTSLSEAELVYAPNVFMPEAEKPENAAFRPMLHPDMTVLEYRLDVYDRWGSLLFRSLDPGAGWAGDMHGKTMAPGVCVWLLDARVLYCGREMQLLKTGNVTIAR